MQPQYTYAGQPGQQVTYAGAPAYGGYAPVHRPAQGTYFTQARPAATPVAAAGATRVVASASSAVTSAAFAGVRPIVLGGTSPVPAAACAQVPVSRNVYGYGQPARTFAAAPTQVLQNAAPRIISTSTYAQGVPVVPTSVPNVVAGPGYTQGAYEDKHKDDAQLKNLKELRQTSGLKEVPVGDGLKSMQLAGGEDGKLTRGKFIEAYEAILQSHGVQMPSDAIKNAVFDLFDRDDNGVVDLMELICGISLLCKGTEDDKIQAVFDIFDANGDGFISMDEMYKFLTSVFKVVLTPSVIAVMNSMGVAVESPEDLASVTALECFKTADLNDDNKLSVPEFKNWFYAPRNDPSFLFSPVRKLLQ